MMLTSDIYINTYIYILYTDYIYIYIHIDTQFLYCIQSIYIHLFIFLYIYLYIYITKLNTCLGSLAGIIVLMEMYQINKNKTALFLYRATK